jgi:hypothetical protein
MERVDERASFRLLHSTQAAAERFFPRLKLVTELQNLLLPDLSPAVARPDWRHESHDS